MEDSHLVAHHIRLLNGRIFQKLLNQDPEALYRSEQGKILTVLWNSETGCATATDIALATGLANNTLTSMLKKLEAIFYKGFSEEEIRQFENYQERILANLKEKANEA